MQTCIQLLVLLGPGMGMGRGEDYHMHILLGNIISWIGDPYHLILQV